MKQTSLGTLARFKSLTLLNYYTNIHISIRVTTLSPFPIQDCYGSRYYIPQESYIPKENPDSERQFPYYRWTAVCLILQAFLFLLPSPIWSALQHICGVNLPGIIATATEVKAPDEASYKRHFWSLAGIIRGSCSGGSKLLICYIIFKALLIVNTITQLVFINHWMGAKYGFLGLEKLSGIGFQNQTLLESSTYPGRILCDSEVRVLGNVRRYTLQCALPHNDIYGRIYVLLFIWIQFLVTVNIASLVTVLVTIAIPSWQETYRDVTDDLQQNSSTHQQSDSLKGRVLCYPAGGSRE